VPDHYQIDLQFVGTTSNLTDRIANREMTLRLEASFCQAINPFLKNRSRCLFKVIRSKVDNQARTLGNRRAHINDCQQVRLGLKIECQCRSTTQSLPPFQRAIVAK